MILPIQIQETNAENRNGKRKQNSHQNFTTWIGLKDEIWKALWNGRKRAHVCKYLSFYKQGALT